MIAALKSFLLPVADRRLTWLRTLGRNLFLLTLALAVSVLMSSTIHVHEWIHHLLEDYEEHDAEMLMIAAFLGITLFLLLRTYEFHQEARRRRTAEENAIHMALHDSLTGLGNRRKMEETLAAVPEGETRVVLMLDLDDFKPINDLFGHATGDRVLEEAARRLMTACGTEFLVCRFGGDEFALLGKTIGDTETVDRTAKAIATALEAPFTVDIHEFQVGTSIGASLFASGSKGATDAIREADLALYRAKDDKEAVYKLFEPVMEDEVRRRTAMERKLGKAIELGAVQPHFQPLVDLKTSEVLGFEALARWTDPELGAVPPNEFIPLAEDTGLITKLSQHLLRIACREAVTWPDYLTLSFNISPKQMKDKLIGLRILGILGETGLSPQRLEIEITEGSLVEDKETARALLLDLRAAGVKIAIDDFGTGYSSLYHLQEFKFDNLKIDRTFIMAMEGGERSDVIVDTILNLANGLGLVATAEGIEQEDQLTKLLARGCQQGQGFLFGKAMSAAEVRQMINEQIPEQATA